MNPIPLSPGTLSAPPLKFLKAEGVNPHVAFTKQTRQHLDHALQVLKQQSDHAAPTARPSRERSIAITKLQEAIMWLGMDLKAMKEAGLSDEPNPYPSSYDPSSPKIEPTADGLKL